MSSEDAQRRTAIPCTGVRTPPQALAIPRALSAPWRLHDDVAPLAFICSTIGSTLVASRSQIDGVVRDGCMDRVCVVANAYKHEKLSRSRSVGAYLELTTR